MNTGAKEKSFSIGIESDLSDVRLVGSFVRSLCASLQITNSNCDDIEVSVCEAVNNAIIHAYRNQPGFQVRVSFAMKSDRLVIEVCDEGAKMSAGAARQFLLGDWLPPELPDHGMGLRIIRGLMDDVEYSSSDRTNTLRMTWRIDRKNLSLER